MNHIALNWINGEWIDSNNHKESINPATGEVIGKYADGGKKEAELAIAAAKHAFKTSDWKHDRHLRYKVLNELAEQFEAHHAELVDTLCLENGKVRGEAEFEFSLVAPKLRYFAAQSLTQLGRALETSPGSFSTVLTEPLGVAAIIAPWNSPIILMVRSLAPALAAGCTAVIKMPAQTAQVNAVMNKVFASVKSLPKGVINQFTEGGYEGASLLVESPDTPTISYTGSTQTGKMLMRNASNELKRLGFELGGKTPMIVFDDANLDLAVPTLEKAITVFAGQFCMTGSRILVQKGIADELIKRLSERLENVKVGPASESDSDMGPLIDKANVGRVEKVVQKAIEQGAKVLVKGGQNHRRTIGKRRFLPPNFTAGIR